MEHRPGVDLCLCGECARKQYLLTLKEPNTVYPDCSDCFLTWCFLQNAYTNFFCDVHLKIRDANTIVKKTPGSAQKADVNCEYAFTLTMPPDYQPKIPLTEVAKKIMEFGLTNKPYEKATTYAYVLEHTEQGTPHIHGVYKTTSGRRIAAKYFNRYWPLWDEKKLMGRGHQGGYHQKARHGESYAAYMDKEGSIIKHVT